MLKGNSAVCKGSEGFNWKCVDEVMLHDGTRLKWSRLNSVRIEAIIGPDLQCVNIDDSVHLKCQHIDIDRKVEEEWNSREKEWKRLRKRIEEQN